MNKDKPWYHNASLAEEEMSALNRYNAGYCMGQMFFPLRGEGCVTAINNKSNKASDYNILFTTTNFRDSKDVNNLIQEYGGNAQLLQANNGKFTYGISVTR